ncbi:MAG: hypothetical protein KAG97_05785, partial [Victivallales bacterium]|nr:hypothetical protein [Victivallales bacterium]
MRSSSILEKLDDALNPITVKELRQTVNSRAISITIMSLLSLELFLMIVFIAQASNKKTMGYGQGFFTAVIGVLMFISLFGVCATSSQRFAKERNGEGTDVIHTTALKPLQIIFGKMASSFALGLFLFSLCLPFLGVSYFMRGIDISTIIFVVALSFTILVPIMQFSILTGAFGNVRASNALLVLVVFSSFITLPGLLFGARPLLSGSTDTWLMLLWTMYAAAVVTGFGFFASVAVLAPYHSNRAMPLRIYLASYWLVSFLVGCAVNTSYGYRAFMAVFYIPAVIIFSIYAAIAVGERDRQTRRVLKRTPKRAMFRLAYYLLSTGRGNGLLFSGFFLLLTTAALELPILKPTFDAYFKDVLSGCSMAASVILIYGILAHFTASPIKRKIPKFNAYVPWFFYLILFNLAPMVLSVLTK